MGALLISCLALPPVPVADAASAFTEIQELLDARAEAVRRGDREAFLATVGPPGSEFHALQAALFDRLSVLPLSDYRLEVDPSAYGDLARPSDLRRYEGADRVVLPLTIERYRLRDSDPEPVPRDLYLTFVQRDGPWRIEGDTDLEDVGFYSARAPWDLGPIEVIATKDLLVVSGACRTCRSAERSIDLAGPVLTQVRSWWEPLPKGRVVMFIPRDGADLARMIEATYPVDNYVAFAFWTGGEGEHPGPRIIVHPEGLEGASTDRVRSILTHEIFHVVALPSSGPFIPRWIEEGFSQYVQYDGSADVIAVADAVSDGALPEDVAFFSGSQSEIIHAYRESLSATRYLVSRWGWDRARELYLRLGRRGIEPGTARFHLDRTMRSVLGVGLGRFERLWASSIGA